MLALQRACSRCGKLFLPASRAAPEAAEAGSLHPRQAPFASTSGRALSSAPEPERPHTTVFGRRIPADWRFLGLAGTQTSLLPVRTCLRDKCLSIIKQNVWADELSELPGCHSAVHSTTLKANIQLIKPTRPGNAIYVSDSDACVPQSSSKLWCHKTYILQNADAC